MSAHQASFVLGLVGAGIGASLTPAMHEREGRAQGLSVAYRSIDATTHGLSAPDLPDLLRWATRLGFDGLNVTHPFKQAVVPLLDELSPAARALGAVNTVVIREGRTTGHNTDASGFVRGLASRLPGVERDRMLLLGAGGAGSAIGWAVLDAGAEHLVVADSDLGRARGLVDRLATIFGPDRVTVSADLAADLAGVDGLIHATPTGMVEHPGLPLPAGLVTPDRWVAEVVYFPLDTELVRLAREAGCRVADGGGMSVFQAVGAFELFTGVDADPERMTAHFNTLVGGAEPALA